MKPLLAHVYEPHRVTYPLWVQPKLNGIRALYQAGRFQSRDEHPFPPGLLEHLSAPLRAVFDDQTILDGELYVHGWPLQRINAAVTPVRNEANEDTVKVEYHVFDVVDFSLPFIDRWFAQYEIACKICPDRAPGHLRFVISEQVSSEHEANEYYSKYVSWGYEGMMYRLGDCPYTMPKQPKEPWTKTSPVMLPVNKSAYLSDQDNRCWHLLKRKSWQDDEFEIVGAEEGEGRLVGALGAIVCTTGNKNSPTTTRFNVGSGFSDDDRIRYWASPPIGKMAKVKFLCLSSDGIPLNPTLLAIL